MAQFEVRRSRSSAALVGWVAGAAVWAGHEATARAEFVVPDGVLTAWVRGASPGSAFAQWESFVSPAGPNAPEVGAFAGGVLSPAAPSWNVADRNPFSFVTGSGNLYSFNGVIAPRIDVPGFGAGAGTRTTVLLQVRVQGTEVDPATVRIGDAAAVEVRELLRQPLGGPGGFTVETLYRFELPGSGDGYRVEFAAFGSSMSLDRLAVDTYTVVPGPGAGGAALVGGLLCIGRRRR